MNPSEPIDLSDLQTLQFMPTWAEELKSAEGTAEVVWGKFEPSRNARPDRSDRGDRRGGGFDRDSRGARPGGRSGPGAGPGRGAPPRRTDGPPPRGENRGPRPERRDGPPPGDRGPRPDRPPGERPPFNRDQRSDNRGPRNFDRRDDNRPPPHPLPGWTATLVPDPRNLEAVARQIKASGRAIAVFDIGRWFMNSRDRYLVRFRRRAGEEERRSPMELMQVPADSSIWVTRDEALRHLLHSDALEKYYTVETKDVDPPKGNFTSVAVCGFSGALLGPPNHHGFPREIARLHRERFANMPLERYKARIKIEKDEALLAKWLESGTKQTQWTPLPTAETTEATEPEPPLKSFAELEAHFLKNHATWACEPIKEATVTAAATSKQLANPLLLMIRYESEIQQRFPMQLVQDLCRLLEGRGLRFFKHDKKSIFVCRARPRFLADDFVLSDRIRSIVEMVRANPGINYTRIVETLSPFVKLDTKTTTPEPAAEPPAPATSEAAKIDPPAEAPPEAAATPTEEHTAEIAAEIAAETAAASEATEAEAEAQAAAVETPASAPKADTAPPQLSAAEIALLQDLRWLVQEGYVTEFQNGELHVLGRPAPPPPPPKAKKEKKPFEGAAPSDPTAPPASAGEAPSTEAATPETAPATREETAAPTEATPEAPEAPDTPAE